MKAAAECAAARIKDRLVSRADAPVCRQRRSLFAAVLITLPAINARATQCHMSARRGRSIMIIL